VYIPSPALAWELCLVLVCLTHVLHATSYDLALLALWVRANPVL
jgi:hypothetical protein